MDAESVFLQCRQTSFPVIQKVGNVDIFVLHKFENKLDKVVEKCKSVFKFIHFIPIKSCTKMSTL